MLASGSVTNVRQSIKCHEMHTKLNLLPVANGAHHIQNGVHYALAGTGTAMEVAGAALEGAVPKHEFNEDH